MCKICQEDDGTIICTSCYEDPQIQGAILFHEKRTRNLICPSCNTVQTGLSFVHTNFCHECGFQFIKPCEIYDCTNPSIRKIEIEIGEKEQALTYVPLCQTHLFDLYGEKE